MLTLAAKGLPAARRQTKVPLLAVAVKQSHPFIIAVLMELQAKLGRLLQDLASACWVGLITLTTVLVPGLLVPNQGVIVVSVSTFHAY